jgi:DNA-binding NtrC family response regulator
MFATAKPKRVFVVDDESSIAITLALILKSDGFDATPFTEPLEALKASRSESPDLLLSDVMMPELTGIDLAIQMLEHAPTCKVLLFSGMPDSAKLIQASRERGHSFELLPKPMDPPSLLSKIQTTIYGTSSEADEPPQLAN